MSNVIWTPCQAFSHEMIAKLVKSGYLQPEQRNDADAITAAIARMKQDLRELRQRGRRSDGGVGAWRTGQ